MATAIVLLTTTAVILSIRTYRDLLEESFRERSTAYAQAFAASAATWLDPVDEAMLRAASRFLLVGSVVFVQIVLDGASVVDERVEGAAELELGSPEAGVAPSIARSPLLGSYLDILATLPWIPEAANSGYVRIGIDVSSVITRARTASMAAGALAIAIDILLILLVRWALRPRQRVQVPVEPSSKHSAQENSITVGALTIDMAGKDVRWNGRAVRLTPKQYALLVLLAREPGRVFSEREIVDEVWSESTYADSKDVKQYVYLVRQRLAEVDPSGRRLVETVPGFGYRLTEGDIDGPLTEG